MTCKEITVAEWNELDYREDTYFANGCVFDEKTDNLIAFSWYEDELHEAGKYYKLVDKFIIPHSKAEQELNLHNNLADLGII